MVCKTSFAPNSPILKKKKCKTFALQANAIVTIITIVIIITIIMIIIKVIMIQKISTVILAIMITKQSKKLKTITCVLYSKISHEPTVHVFKQHNMK